MGLSGDYLPAPERQESLTPQLEGGLTTMPKTCRADVTLRDEEHALAVCDKPLAHRGAHYDAALDVLWTDADHA